MSKDFKYCKRINKLDESLLFAHDEYFCYGTKVQISGIYTLTEPYRTGAYWDDIAYISLMTKEGGNIALLGSGLLSFVPLLKSKLTHKLKISCVDINESVLEFSKRIQASQGQFPNLEINYFCEDVQKLPSGFFKKIDSLFIDIYNEFEISEIALDVNFLNTLKNELPPEAVIAININDVKFSRDSSCATRLFFNAVSLFWENILLARRSSSTTMLFSSQVAAESIKEKLLLQNINSSKDYEFIDEAKKVFSEQKITISNDFLRFDEVFQEELLEQKSLFLKVIKDLKALTALDVVRLLKKGN